MTNTQSTNSQGNQQNSLNRLIESIKRNKMVLIGATLAGIMSNFIGFMVDIVEFKTLINPEPTDLSHEWVVVKITGYSVASYDFAEQPGTGMLKAFFTNKLEGISKLTPQLKADKIMTDIDSYGPINNLPALEKIIEEYIKTPQEMLHVIDRRT